jgi:hypothetical protein
VLGLVFMQPFPSNAHPYAFGFLWLAGAVVVFPMASAFVLRATAREPGPEASEVHHQR